MRRSPDQTKPEFRQLQIYALDPMVSRAGDHEATVQIRYEDLNMRGGDGKGFDPISFRGRRVEVADLDASGPAPVWIKPVNLNDAKIAMTHGLEPSESDPQFHQQMVFAIAMRTLEQFDRALGRIVYFKNRRRLRLLPHAFRGSNAFYHPRLRAVLFGYFQASRQNPGENLPGQTIFTCLSHDIVAHEVTHGIVDSLRPFFNTATNPHVRAFHEGFADIVAVFQRLSFHDLVRRALQDANGNLGQSRLLSDIAAQFGQGLGSGKALRTALDAKTRIQDVEEEHALGAVLVAAVFEGFYTTFQRRTADLIRIATGGSGVLPEGALHPDLVARLTTECVRTAQSVLTMCIRAFDYLPPADVTFGAFLRALVTADWELNPLDEYGLRASLIEACRRRGIFAMEAGSLAVKALLLDSPPEDDWKQHEPTFQKWIDLAIQMGVAEQRAETPEDEAETAFEPAPQILNIMQQNLPPVRSSFVEKSEHEELRPEAELRKDIKRWFQRLSAQERQKLGMSPNAVLTMNHANASQRTMSDGTQRFRLVVQLVEEQTVEIAGVTRKHPSGATMAIDVTGKVRFVVAATPLQARLASMKNIAEKATTNALGWPMEAPSLDPFAVDYRGMHEDRT